MEKYKFFISRSQVFGYIVSLGLIDPLFILVLIGVIVEQSFLDIIIVLAGLIFMNLYTIYILIPYMMKVYLSHEGIEIMKPKKQRKFIKWEEIETAYVSIIRNIRYITFEIKKEKIEFEIDKKRLDVLKKLCTNQNILNILNNIKLSYFIFNQKHGPM